MYHKELARTGHGLFIVRAYYIHAAYIGAALVAWHSGRFGPFESAAANHGWQIAALTVALIGAVIRFVTSGYAAMGTSGIAKKAAEAAELNTTGPYSLVRNPLYTGRIINFTGIAMLSGSWVYSLFVFLLSVLIYERISIYEEQFLVEKFGDEHRKWAEKTPALTPKLSGWVKPKYKFWWRRAIWREYKKIHDLATALILVDFARRGFEFPENMTFYYIYAGLFFGRLATSMGVRFGWVFSDLK